MKHWIICCLIGLAWLAAGGKISAQQPALSVSFDSNLVETGNPFMLRILVPASLGRPVGIDLTAWDSLIPPENRLKAGEWQEKGKFWYNEFPLIVFDEGVLNLAPVRIALDNGQYLEGPPMTLTVAATPAPKDLIDVADIKDIHREPKHWTDYTVYYIAGLSALLLVWLLYRLSKRKPRRQAAQSREMTLSADERALQKLAALSKKELWQRGDIKLYYQELSMIARQYLTDRFEVPALVVTSRELLSHLYHNGSLERAWLPRLSELFEQSDLAKFAKNTPTPVFHQQAFDLVHALVLQTRLQADPNPTSTGTP